MDADHDDSLDIQIRPAIDLVRRAALLAVIAERGVLEIDAERGDYERDTDRFELLSWARGALAGTVTGEELLLLATPIGELGDDLARCDDALTCAAAIAWAINVAEVDRLPIPPDGEVEKVVMSWAPTPWTDLDRLARKLVVRADEAIAAERERWELWYWRARDCDEADEALTGVVADLATTGLIPTIDGDLATDAAEPFSTLSPDQQDEIAWLAEHRLRALNWVCGFGDGWDSVPIYPD